MSVELMLNAVNINLVAFSAFLHERRRPGLRPVRHHDRRRRGRRRPGDRAAHLPQPAQSRSRRGRPAEGLTAPCSNYAWLIPAIPAVSFVLILLLRQAVAAQGLRDRHRRRRRVVRARRASRVVQWIHRVERRHGRARRGHASAAFGRGRSAPTGGGRRGRRSRRSSTHVTWWQNGGVEVRRRHPDRRPRGDDAVRRHPRSRCSCTSTRRRTCTATAATPTSSPCSASSPRRC